MTVVGKQNGQGGTAIYGSSSVPNTEWTATFTAEALDGTDTASGGWVERYVGIKEVSGSIKIVWGGSATQLATLLAPGRIDNLSLPLGQSGFAYSGSAFIDSVTPTNPAKGLIEATINFKSTGSWSGPA